MFSATHETGGNADRNGNGQFATGNTVTREGSPNRAAWIKQQIQDTCTEVAVAKLKKLGESDKASDQAIYWSIVGKTLPQQVQAEVGGIGSIGEACDAALKRVGITGGKTQLGDVDG